MNDSISQTGRISPSRPTERVAKAAAAPPSRNKRDDEAEFSFEDKIDVHVPEQPSNALEELDLSITMIRALLHRELPEETAQALMDFAPLGNLSNGFALCDRTESRGIEFVTWKNTETLAHALERAAG